MEIKKITVAKGNVTKTIPRDQEANYTMNGWIVVSNNNNTNPYINMDSYISRTTFKK